MLKAVRRISAVLATTMVLLAVGPAAQAAVELNTEIVRDVTANVEQVAPKADSVLPGELPSVPGVPSTPSGDTVPPETTILTGPPAYTNNATPTFTFSADEPGSTFECSRNTGQPYVACASGVVISPAYSDGAKVFRVRATDTALNVDPSPATWSFLMDQVAPTASFTSVPAAWTNEDPVRHEFTSADALSGVDTVTCAFDLEAPAPCVSPILRSLPDGRHGLLLRVTDRAGNERVIQNVFDVDVTAPTTSIVSGPSALTTSTTATFTFTTEDGSGRCCVASCQVDGFAEEPCVSGETFGPFTDGQHSFRVYSTDEAGNISPAVEHFWMVDATVPVATITSGPSGGFVASASVSFDFVSDESPSTFECSVDAALFSSCTSPVALSGLADGSHSFDVRAIDAAGNTGPAASRSWTVDTTAPTVTITAAPTSPSSNASPTFAFSGTDGGSGLTGFECRLNTASFSSCVSGLSVSLTTQGAQTFDVRSIDAAGNVSAPATHGWTFDSVAPQTTMLTGPPAYTNVASQTFTFSSDEPGSTFACSRLTGQPYVACVSPYTPVAYTDGTRVFRVVATDAAGNVDASPASWSFVLDRVLPTASFTSVPANPTNADPVSHAFTRADASSGIDTVTCAFDGETPTACVSPILRSLLDGSHTLVIRVTDRAGNLRTISNTFVVDRTAPTTTIVSGPSALTSSTSATFVFTRADGSGSGVASSACRVDGGSFALCTSGQTFGPFGDGPHTFDVRSTDVAGNVGPSASHAWTVDATVPVATITSGPSGGFVASASASFDFVSDESPSTFECSVDGASFSSCTSPAALSGLTDGPHSFDVRAIDAAGNTGPVASRSWTVDATAPVATISSGPADPSSNASPSFSFSGSDAESGVAGFECALNSGSFAACVTGESFALSAQGAQTFEVRSLDAAGNVSVPAAHGWTFDTVAPETTITSGPSAFTNDASPSFSFVADEVATFECSRDTGEPYVTCSTGFVFTPAYTDGSKTFRVRATDGAGNTDGSSAELSFLLDQVVPDLAFSSVPAGVTNADPVLHDFSTFDASSGVNRVECAYDAEPFAACVSAVSRSFLDGPHALVVRVTDRAGNVATISDEFTVDLTAPAVAITSGPSGLTSSTSATFTFTSSDVHATTTVCVLDGTATDPACTSPALYSGPLADGVHTFDLTVTDVAGNVTSLRRTWTVDAIVPVATITSGPSGGFVASASASFDFVSDESPSTFECSVDAAAFSSCTSPAGLSGLSDGAHSFDVRATDAAGNTGPAASRSWTVDTTAPTVAITAAPTSPSSNASPSFSFSGSDAGSGLTGFECALNSGSFATCATGDSFALSGQGAQTFEVRSIDSAGNVAAPATHTWNYDSVAPETTILTGPPAFTNVATQTFTFSSDEPGSTFACSRLTGQPYVACVSPYTPVAYTDGTRVFRVRATDAAGNVDASPASWSFVLDRVLPTASFTSIPANPTNADPVSHAFTRADARSGIDTVTCAFDGEVPTACVSPISRSLLDGSHTLVIRVTDRAGNLRTISNSFVVDLTAPTVAITSGPSGLTSSTSASFTFTSSDVHAMTAVCVLDGTVTDPACASPALYGGPLADGVHTFDLTVTDEAGNATSLRRTWTVDATPPVTTITSGPAEGSNSSSNATSFEFEANESPVTFECSLDGVLFTVCTSPDGLSALSDDVHGFRVRAIDAAGNVGLTAQRSWRVDTIAPTAAITDGPLDPSADGSPRFWFEGFDTGSGVARFECALNSGSFAACESGDLFALSAQGPQTFEVRSIDAAGNVGAPATYGWTYDSIPPETTILTGSPAYTNIATQTFTFESDEPVSTFECSGDTGQPYVACSSPYTPSPYSDGAKVFSVRATDAAGNVDPTSASWSFLLDRVAPTASFASIPADPTNADPVYHSFTHADDSSGVDTVTCSFDGEAEAACDSSISRSLIDGSHTLVIRVTDRAGNLRTISNTFVVDLTAPVATITGTPTNPSNDAAPSFTFSAEDGTGSGVASFRCQLNGAGYSTCSSPHVSSLPADGPYAFDVQAIDAAGNFSAAVSYSWLFDATAPQSTISSAPPTYTNVTAATVEFSATDAGSGVATYACDIDGAGFVSCVSPLSQVALSDGLHTVAVRATDNAGNTETAVSVSWTVDTALPVTVLTAKPKHFCCEPGTTATFEWTTNGTGSPVTGNECSVDGAAFAACSSPHVVTGVTEGVHEFQIRGLDAAGNVEAPVVYTWTQGDHPDTTIDTMPATPTASTTADFTFSSDRSPVTFRCLLQRNGGPLAYFQTCVTPKSYTGLEEGSYTFKARAFDALNNPDPEPATYDFVVDLTGPVVTVDPGSSPTASSTVSFTFEANDPDATFECSMDGSLYGACSSPYAATGLSDGSHTFSVRAADALGNTSAPVSASVVVDTAGPSATIASGPASPTSSASATFTFSATDGSGTGVAELQCSLDAGAFAACTSPTTLSGLTNGAHTFAVRAVDAVGNVGPPVSHAWTVDGLAPTVTITSPTPGVYAANSQIATSSGVYSFGDIIVSASIADPSGVPSVVFAVNGTAVLHTCAAGSCSANITSTGPGTVATVTVTAVDAAGNTKTATLSINFMS